MESWGLQGGRDRPQFHTWIHKVRLSEFTQPKGFQPPSAEAEMLCRMPWLDALDQTGGFSSGAELLVQGTVSTFSTCKPQATHSSMNLTAQHQNISQCPDPQEGEL